MQVPAETRVTVVPDTVQTPVVAEVKATVKLLEADAERLKVPVPIALSDRAPKVMVWLALYVRVTEPAEPAV